MGNYFDKPEINLKTDFKHRETERIYVASCNVQGYRKNQEDFIIQKYGITRKDYIDPRELEAKYFEQTGVFNFE